MFIMYAAVFVSEKEHELAAISSLMVMVLTVGGSTNVLLGIFRRLLMA